MEAILLPLGICVALPVLIVWLVMRARQNEINRKTEVMLKAIETGVEIDKSFFSSQVKQTTIKERLLEKLTAACVCAFLGVIGLIISIIWWKESSCNINDGPIPFLMLGGGILLAVGLAFLISYFIGKKMLAKEIEFEEKKLGKLE